MRFRQVLPLIGALFALYIIWGSTYFVIRIGVESWPPLLMAGVRFLSAGVLLLAFLLLTGHKLPSLRPLLNAALIGVLLLAIGNGFVTVAEHQDVPSGIAAVVVATVPLFTLCFSRLFGIKTRKLEWMGIAIGLAGIVLLNSGGNLSGNPWGALIIMVGSMSWAFGSVYGSRIELPSGMMAGAIEMLAAGIVLLVASLLTGERLTTLPTREGFMAVAYLALFGSIIAINAYMYLIRNVSPAVATSYAYVNPVVAVLLGTGFGGEHLSGVEWLALGVIILAVVLVTLGKYLFPAPPVVTPCEAKKPLDAFCVDLRGGVAVADPLFQPLAQRFVSEFQTAAQGALPDNQHAPPLLAQQGEISGVPLHVLANFLHPEFSARRRNLKQVAVMVVPETSVSEDDAAVFVNDEIRAARQRGILNAPGQPKRFQQPGEAFFNCRIPGCDSAHIFAARRLIMYIRHSALLSADRVAQGEPFEHIGIHPVKIAL